MAFCSGESTSENAVSVNITSGKLATGAAAAVGMSAHQKSTRSISQKPARLTTTPVRDHLRDVPVDVVAELVGEDDVDFFGRELFQQRVAHQHAAGAAEAGEHRVCFLRVGAEAEAVDAFDREAGAGGQLLHAARRVRRLRSARSCRTAA